MQDIIRDLLIKIGENPDREGLKKTPERFENSIAFLTQGYRQDPREVLRGAIFHEQYDEMVPSRTSTSSPCASTTCSRSSGSATWRTYRESTSSGCRRSPASSSSTPAGSRYRSG